MTDKVPFDIEAAFAALPDAVAPYARAALFELFDEGYRDPFEILVACVVSIRTRDEVTLPVARRVFALARTPSRFLSLPTVALTEGLIGTAFASNKAANIVAIARRCVEEHAGRLPCDFEALTSLPGVGPKCANLVLGIACGKPSIAVDIHVHRVTNRWGYVKTSSPESTMAALEQKLPKEYWVAINRLLVPFGKHVCSGSLPRCSTCPLEPMCAQADVTRHR